ncbi:MAG: hypothetical protein FD153_26 [Rhodospirillaceae bacterium]|nr:MAG: hypothetical protein FD153_26 [Rhodospirillaceae bacterium]
MNFTIPNTDCAVEIDDAIEESLRTRAALEIAVKSGADLARAYLYGATLFGAKLGGANLFRADLTGANLRGAKLGEADLTGANLRGATLGGATLGGANLGEADLTGAKLDGAKLEDGSVLVGDRPIQQLGPIGSHNAYLITFHTDKGIRVKTGCYFGDLAGFETAVSAKHGDNQHGHDYRAAIAFIRALWPDSSAKAEVLS